MNKFTVLSGIHTEFFPSCVGNGFAALLYAGAIFSYKKRNN